MQNLDKKEGLSVTKNFLWAEYDRLLVRFQIKYIFYNFNYKHQLFGLINVWLCQSLDILLQITLRLLFVINSTQSQYVEYLAT